MRIPLLLKPRVRSRLRFLLESQYWTIEEMRAYQWRKLDALISHAYRHVPYYRNLFDKNGISLKQIQCPGDVKQIPILTKRAIKGNLDELVDPRMNRSGLCANYTGGSTGEPLRFYQDRNYIDWAEAARIRAWKYFPGFDERQREALLWGADRDLAATLTVPQMLAMLLTKADLKLNAFRATQRRLRRFTWLFNLLKPRILRGYASSLTCFCDYLTEHNLTVHPPACVISSAELLTEANRRKIERVLKAKVFNSYGCREVSQIATECHAHDGLHVVMENQYVEIDNGRIIVTNLNNFSMPFIRYEVGDIADGFISTKCSCGRALVRLHKIKGRVSDTLKFGSNFVHAEYITHLFYRDTPVSRFQIVRNEKANRLTVLMDKQDKRLEADIRKKLRGSLPTTNINVVVTDRFAHTPTGKLQIVVDEKNI